MKRFKLYAPRRTARAAGRGCGHLGPVAIPGSAPTAHAQTAVLAIDADTTNGICTTVDTNRTVAAGTYLTVGICLLGGSGVTGINTVALSLPYDSGLSATNVASDLTTDLNSNPNFNEGRDRWVVGLQSAEPFDSAPKASPSPATINCTTTNSSDVAVSPPLLLATLSLTANSGAVPERRIRQLRRVEPPWRRDRVRLR